MCVDFLRNCLHCWRKKKHEVKSLFQLSTICSKDVLLTFSLVYETVISDCSLNI